MTEPAPISVKLLEKEFIVACKPEERSELQEAAKFLNGKMREIRDTGRVVGMDRIAVMAALNLAHELLKTRGRDALSGEVGTRLRTMRERVESVLTQKGQQLEL